jgi:hypothetical protein
LSLPQCLSLDWAAPTTQQPLPQPSQAKPGRRKCCCAVTRLAVSHGEGDCTRPARISLCSMASSPIIADTPRTLSPAPSEEDGSRPQSPAHDDVHVMAALSEFEEAGFHAPAAAESVERPCQPPAPAVETANKAPKGKEKAVKGPLRLLDLPVDILKEIIHQVRVQPRPVRCCCAL